MKDIYKNKRLIANIFQIDPDRITFGPLLFDKDDFCPKREIIIDKRNTGAMWHSDYVSDYSFAVSMKPTNKSEEEFRNKIVEQYLLMIENVREKISEILI